MEYAFGAGRLQDRAEQVENDLLVVHNEDALAAGAGIDLRTMGGETAGDADSYTLRFDVVRLTG